MPSRGKGYYCSLDCRDAGWTEHLRRFIGKRGPTQPELKVMHALQNLFNDFESEVQIGRFVVDFYIPKLHYCLEVDGDYWHSLPRSQERDYRKDKYLRNQGYRVIRISESDINAAECVTTLVAKRLGLFN